MTDLPSGSSGLATTGQAPVVRRPRSRRHALILAMALPVILGGCQVPAFDAYRGSTTQAQSEFKLWVGTFIAAIVVGVIVAALILFSVIRYRRRSDAMPKQFQYHFALEVIYTLIPLIIVLVLFAFTVVTENNVDALPANPALKVKVTAFQWGWRFQYSGTHVDITGKLTEDPDPIGINGGQCAPSAACLGPGLVLPVGQNVQVTLVSNDVVHGFYVPAFNFSRYALPGVTNQFAMDIKAQGIYRAQCTQLCGLYHSLMYFHVVALPAAQFHQWLAQNNSTTSQGAGVGSLTSGNSAVGSTSTSTSSSSNY